MKPTLYSTELKPDAGKICTSSLTLTILYKANIEKYCFYLFQAKKI